MAFIVQGSTFNVQGSGFNVPGSTFRVPLPGCLAAPPCALCLLPRRSLERFSSAALPSNISAGRKLKTFHEFINLER